MLGRNLFGKAYNPTSRWEAVLGIVGKLGLTRIRLNAAECTSCKVCDRACFAHIDVSVNPCVREAECNQRPEALTSKTTADASA